MNKQNRPASQNLRASIIGLLLFLLHASVSLALDLARVVDFNVPPQPLASAALQFSTQAGVQVIASGPKLDGLASKGVKGRLSIDDGLKALLEGTGLVFKVVGDNTISFVADGGRVEAPKQKLEKIEVTGSRLARTEAEGSSPVTVFTREDIERTGVNTLQQLIKYLPQASVVNDPISIFAGGATVRLRGLPTGTTLVLINGRRAIVSGALNTANVFNLNNIPLAAVERVEILTDSASAVYGADALAGVVNIILKKGVKDVTVDLRYGGTTDGATDNQTAALTAGFDQGWAKGTVVLEGFRQSPLYGRDRDRVHNSDYRRFGGVDSRDPYTSPGNVYSASGNLPGLNAPVAGIPLNPSNRLLTRADFAATSGTPNLGAFSGYDDLSLLNDTNRKSIFGRFDFEATPALRPFIELSRNESSEIGDLPNVLAGNFGLLTVPATNPFNPFGVPVGIASRLDGTPVSRLFEWTYTRALAGLSGDLGSWTWEIAALSSKDRLVESDRNTINMTALNAALADTNPATSVNLFRTGPLTDAEQARIFRTPVLDLQSSARQFDGNVKGTCLQLLAEPIECLVGFESRHERLKTLSPTGDRVPLDTARDVRSYFGEVSIPIIGREMRVPFVDRLGAIVAARTDRYSDFGNSTNPQYGLKWTVTPDVLVRASRGEAFRAPSLVQSSPIVNRLTSSITDPARSGERYATAVDIGGNASLEPESGTSTNIGLVVTPNSVRGLSLSADLWHVKQDERILRPPGQTIVSYESTFPAYVIRGAPTPEDIAAGLPGRVTLIRDLYLNFGSADIRGVDARISYAYPSSLGLFTNTAAATYTLKYDAAVAPGQPMQDRVGAAFMDGYAPSLKAVLSSSWEKGGSQLSLIFRYTSSYQDYADPRLSRRVSAQWLTDLSGAYTWTFPENFIRTIRLAGGVNNLFDREPPYSNFNGLGWDQQQGDIVGRTAYLALRLQF